MILYEDQRVKCNLHRGLAGRGSAQGRSSGPPEICTNSMRKFVGSTPRSWSMPAAPQLYGPPTTKKPSYAPELTQIVSSVDKV
jgi:hypothetical protein